MILGIWTEPREAVLDCGGKVSSYAHERVMGELLRSSGLTVPGIESAGGWFAESCSPPATKLLRRLQLHPHRRAGAWERGAGALGGTVWDEAEAVGLIPQGFENKASSSSGFVIQSI